MGIKKELNNNKCVHCYHTHKIEEQRIITPEGHGNYHPNARVEKEIKKYRICCICNSGHPNFARFWI